MLLSYIVDYLDNYFQPIPTIEPGTPESCVAHALDYFNCECGETRCDEISPTIGQNRSAVIDMTDLNAISVVDVIPRVPNMVSEVGSVDSITDLILLNWTDKMLTGGGGQYRDMQQLILTRQFLAQYRQYFGLRFDWRFFQEIGRLTVNQMPYGAVSLFVTYKREIPAHPFSPNYRLQDRFAFRLIKEYSLALFQLRQGEILSKATAVGLDVQGASIKQEGLASKERLEQQLAKAIPMPSIR